MNAHKPLPIGPLAIMFRHLPPTSTGRRIAVLVAAFASALLVGIVLLVR